MQKILNKAILLLALLPVVFGCSSKDEAPLELDSNSFMVVTGIDSQFAIKQGNGNYEVVAEDQTIVSAGFVRTDKSPGALVFKGLKPGHTKVTVKDKATGEQVTVTVYVAEPYFAITGTDFTEADIRVLEGTEVPEGLKEELEKNEPLGYNFAMLFFQKSDRLFVEIDKGSLVSLYEGSYAIRGTREEPLLDITFDNGTEEITATYLLSESGSYLMLAFLAADLPAEGTRKSIAPDYYDITLTEFLTAKLSRYPNIVSASLDINCVASANKWMNPAFITKYY